MRRAPPCEGHKGEKNGFVDALTSPLMGLLRLSRAIRRVSINADIRACHTHIADTRDHRAGPGHDSLEAGSSCCMTRARTREARRQQG